MSSGLCAAVEEFIKENGPVTVREIYGNVPFTESSIRVALSYLCRDAKRIHVHSWEEYEYGHLLRALAKYAHGRGRNAPKPPRRTRQEHKRRHHAKKKVRVNSVFQLGISADERRVTARKRLDMQKPARTQPSSGAGSLG